ncbi:MAG: UGSC family (seleno)protein, partial [Burkholderiales bacterium]|nr:UGSC family (seleno)protein [Burkholderiales bacterium]
SVVTTEFKDAISAQSLALGFEPAIVYVPHPIQNRTAEELRQIADDIIAPALAMMS